MKIHRLPVPLILFLAAAAAGCGGDDRMLSPASASACCPDDEQAPCPASLVCGHGCMRRHVEDGRSLNRERMPLYEALTGGASLPVSRMLIGYETLSLPFADSVDRQAEPWQREEICVACFAFVSMEETPPFRDAFEGAPPDLAEYRPPDAVRLARSLRRAQRDGGFAGLRAELEARLAALDPFPGFHCMLRHILESMLRIASLAPLCDRMARDRGLASPLDVSSALMDLHFAVLGQAVALDGMAAPLQAGGVPILCQDLPPIAPLPDNVACWTQRR